MALFKKKKGAIIKFASVNENGEIDVNEFKKQITDKTKIIAFTHISNVTGAVLPVKKIVDLAKIKKYSSFNRWDTGRSSFRN